MQIKEHKERIKEKTDANQGKPRFANQVDSVMDGIHYHHNLPQHILCWRDLNDWRSSLCRGACIHCAMRWLRGYTIPYTIQMSTCPSVLFSFFFSFLPPVWGARFTIRNTGGVSCSWFDWRARRQKQGGIDGGGGANAKLGGIGGMGWDINTSTFGEDVAATFSRECQGIAGLHRRQ